MDNHGDNHFSLRTPIYAPGKRIYIVLILNASSNFSIADISNTKTESNV